MWGKFLEYYDKTFPTYIDQVKHVLDFIKFACKRMKSNNFEYKDNEGSTPIHELFKKKINEDAITEILNLKVGINIQDNSGYTPLHQLCIHNDISIKNVKLICNEKGDFNITNQSNETPFYTLCRNPEHDPTVIRFLISNKSDLNISTKSNMTPLYRLCQRASIEMKTLAVALENKGEFNRLNTHGLSPINALFDNKILYEKASENILDFLIDKNLIVDTSELGGDNPVRSLAYSPYANIHVLYKIACYDISLFVTKANKICNKSIIKELCSNTKLNKDPSFIVFMYTHLWEIYEKEENSQAIKNLNSLLPNLSTKYYDDYSRRPDKWNIDLNHLYPLWFTKSIFQLLLVLNAYKHKLDRFPKYIKYIIINMYWDVSRETKSCSII